MKGNDVRLINVNIDVNVIVLVIVVLVVIFEIYNSGPIQA